MSVPTGAGIGDFDFLAGEWTIENGRLIEPVDASDPDASTKPTWHGWHQASSCDNGVTWDHNWFMRWTRRKP